LTVAPQCAGGRLYTGPLFVKYNAVLRGVQQGANAYLRSRYLELCAMEEVFERHKSGDLSWEAATKRANGYTTTIHAINSCIVKSSKLTKACKVYRGIREMALPKKFYTRNAFNVAGGVEPGFMSTTAKREVAVSYGSGQSGIVFEMQMGMVDRGADIAWLSQVRQGGSKRSWRMDRRSGVAGS